MDNTVDNIMNTFDFDKVYRYMVFTNWKWAGKVPSLEEIKAHARGLLDELQDNHHITATQCGGFIAEANRTGEIPNLILYFCIESQEEYL